ncbi:hypothetical protein ACWCPQ_05470 [Nocardia sp. NPDC001965]
MLSLPVTTDIAQVRGHDGYGFPKWVTDIDVDTGHTSARVAGGNGATDLALSVATPHQTAYRSGDRVSTLTSCTRLGGAWRSTVRQTDMLSSGSALLPRGIDLEIGHGRMAEDLRSLEPIKTVRLDVTTEGQLALQVPVPIAVPGRN